ncbi:MAG: VWA domain-containing protein [Acidobacteriales bacterium]|nr:MAG: VWA domain-containing protein [Terriglobales bacterium]
MTRWWLVGAFAAVFACSAQPQEQPTFRATTNLVDFTIVALDGNGNPITDLKQDEITVTDSGKSRDLAFFRFEGGAQKAAVPKTLPAGGFTNRSEYAPGPTRNIAAIVLDTLNTPAQDQMWVRAQVMRYLRVLAPETRVAVYSLGEQMAILHDFTEDTGSLRERLARSGLGSQAQVTADIDQMVRDAEALLEAIPPSKRALTTEALTANLETEMLYNARVRERRVMSTLASLEALGNHLAGIPGRKSMVWISGGISILSITSAVGIKSYEPLVRGTSERLANQGITMYLVDKRGLYGRPGTSAETGRAPTSEIGRLGGGPFQRQQELARKSSDPLPAMMLMAEVTGGRVVMNTNDLSQGMKAAVADLRGSYSLGFYALGEPDGKWHKLNVRVKRRGVKLVHRQGYVSETPAAQSPDWPAEQWNAAMYNPLGSTALHLDARCERAPGDGTLSVSLSIPAEDLHFRKVGDQLVADLDIGIGEKTAAGVLGLWQEKATAIGDPAGSVRYRKSWKVNPAASTIRLIVRDRLTGRFGTLEVAVRNIPAQPAN